MFVVHFRSLQSSFLGHECVAMEIERCVESVSILGTVHISFQYSIRNPTLAIQVCVICSEPTALGEWLVGLQVFVSFPECGVHLSVGVSKVIMGG